MLLPHANRPSGQPMLSVRPPTLGVEDGAYVDELRWPAGGVEVTGPRVTGNEHGLGLDLRRPVG